MVWKKHSVFKSLQKLQFFNCYHFENGQINFVGRIQFNNQKRNISIIRLFSILVALTWNMTKKLPSRKWCDGYNDKHARKKDIVRWTYKANKRSLCNSLEVNASLSRIFLRGMLFKMSLSIPISMKHSRFSSVRVVRSLVFMSFSFEKERSHSTWVMTNVN